MALWPLSEKFRKIGPFTVPTYDWFVGVARIINWLSAGDNIEIAKNADPSQSTPWIISGSASGSTLPTGTAKQILRLNDSAVLEFADGYKALPTQVTVSVPAFLKSSENAAVAPTWTSPLPSPVSGKILKCKATSGATPDNWLEWTDAPTIPVPTVADVRKVLQVDSSGSYVLGPVLAM